MSTKKQQAQANKNSSSLAKASSIDITKSLGAISNAGVQIQNTLSKISEELITKTAELQAVDDSIKLKKEEMTTLHGADQILLSIDELKAQHARELEMQQMQVADFNAALKAQQQEAEVQRKREQENYDYQLQQKRKIEADAYNETLRTRNNNERDRMEAFNKDIEQRENDLKSKEQQYNDAIMKAQMFDSELEKAVAKQVAIVTNTMKKDFEHEKQITAVQNTAQLEKLKYDNARLIEQFNNVEVQNRDLQTKLESAYNKNAELAQKAVESAANTKSVADMQSLITNVGANGSRPRS